VNRKRGAAWRRHRRQLPESRVAGQTDHQLRVEKTDRHLPIGVLPHDHIARQQKANVGLGLQGPVCKRGITSAKNPIGPKPSALSAARTCGKATSKVVDRNF